MCFTSIFGKDIDSFTWDYGMTDGRQYHKIILYAYGAAKLARLNDHLSQPGNIRHVSTRPFLELMFDFVLELDKLTIPFSLCMHSFPATIVYGSSH